MSDKLVDELSGSFDGKLLWYAATVKLDLEARGIIERVQVQAHIKSAKGRELIDEQILKFRYKRSDLTISYFIRRGSSPGILFLHGLGCAKNDFYSAIESQYLKDMTLVGLDFPGCGLSSYPETARLGIDDLVTLTNNIIEKLALHNITIVGHSMSGLVGLLLAEQNPQIISGLINVEGNLAASDCFFSGKVAGMERQEFIEKAFTKYVHRVKLNKNAGLQAYAKILVKYTNPAGMRDVCPSLVEYSKTGDLLERFLKLKQPIQFIYGSKNSDLP